MAYSVVIYLNVSFSGLIACTSRGEERVDFYAIDACNFVVSGRMGFVFLWLLA